MIKKQYFDIKYPFTNDGVEKYEFDLSRNEKEKIASQLLHLLFTPKGQKLRKPQYGTDLIRYIFEPYDSLAWEEIKNEIKDSVNRWLPGVNLTNVEVMASESGEQIFVRIDYSVRKGNYAYNNSIAVEI